MNKSEFLRFALILSDGQASTFRKNLSKMIKLVLFDSYGTQLTIWEISQQSRKAYDLEFSDAEILDAIKADRNQVFVEVHNTNDPYYFRFTITPNEYEKLKLINISDHFEEIATRFVHSTTKREEYVVDVIKNTVLRYIYSVFNADIKTVLSLMNCTNTNQNHELPKEQFSESEMNLLNEFLNWDDIEKNKCIFNAISSCYEFCMMTIKKDNSSFLHIFNGKEFFLDTNIIFRLAGFNNNERQEVVESFLRKCKECGIKIKYTNFTNTEISNTLSHNVGAIHNQLNGRTPICTEAMKIMSPKYANLNFYDLFFKWIQIPGYHKDDYNSFLRYLRYEVEKCLKNMTFVKFESHEKDKISKIYQNLIDEFTKFKGLRHRSTFEGSIKVDVENYMFLRSLEPPEKHNSFLDKKFYFITADHIYIDWANGNIPGAIPTFVLPSVWYSIMLKFKGRTDNDYNAFCQFLNLRISEPNEPQIVKRQEMLQNVLRLEESVEIKEQIVFDIDMRLTQEFPCIIDIESFVEESHKRVTEKTVQEALVIAEKQHREETEALKSDLLQEDTVNQKLVYDRGTEVGFLSGRKKGIDDFIEVVAKSQVIRNRTIKIAGIVLSIVFLLVSCVSLALLFFYGETSTVKVIKFLNDNSAVSAVISLILALFAYLLSRLNKYIDFLSTDVDIVSHKLESKFLRTKHLNND